MARYEVRFDGSQKEIFYDRGQACEWAEEVAATGRVVDVVQRLPLAGRRFVTAYPESERTARATAWAAWSAWQRGGGGG